MTAKKATEVTKKATAPVKAAEPVKAVAVAAPTKEETVKAAPVKKTAEVKKAVASVKEEPKKAAAPVKEEPKKAAAPVKAAEPKKAAPKKAAAKTVKTEKAALSQNVYIQFAGKELLTQDLLERAKQDWTAQGHRAASMKSMDLYIKPEDGAAYYVVNGKDTGKVEL